MNKRILHIAIPSIISNITVPLLGLVDIIIVGHLGSSSYIGAIAVGGLIFNIIYWLFSFLRMGTSGFTAQAFGSRNKKEIYTILCRVSMIALSVSLLMIIFQWPIEKLIFFIVHSTPNVQEQATIYYRICIYGAPAVLGLYGFTGWFIGMQNSRIPMYIAIFQNVINIIVSLFLVFVCDMKVAGVASGTLIAQYSGLIMALFLWKKYYNRFQTKLTAEEIFSKIPMLHYFKVNRDIFLRTLCLIAVTTFFTSAGAREGDKILAANTLLLQFFTLFSYVMDGFAFSGEALTGRYIGSSNMKSLSRLITLLFRWGFIVTGIFTIIYILCGKLLLHLFTNETIVLLTSMDYLPWIYLIPIAGFAAFLWDGILIGATKTRIMLISMSMAMMVFFIFYFVGRDRFGNHALWFSFLSYLCIRGIMEWLLWNSNSIGKKS